MELYIFNRDLTYKGLIDNFFSFRWVRKYYKAGEFELHCPLTTATLDLLQKDNIIYKKDDDEAGYIECKRLSLDEEGNEILVVNGRFLTKYFNRRIVWNNSLLSNTTENVMRTLVDTNCINPTNTDRIISNLILGTNNGFTETSSYLTKNSKLSDILEDLSVNSNIGYKISFDISSKQLIFNVYKGLDRSVNQSANPIAVFSKKFENILNQEYIESINNYSNVVLGIGEGIDITVGNATGLDRFETFVLDMTTDINVLTEKASSVLANSKKIETFNSVINLNSNLQYKSDFDLGDIVTCISKNWNVVIDVRITEIEEVYEQDGTNINVTFGNSIPTLIDKIKKMR